MTVEDKVGFIIQTAFSWKDAENLSCTHFPDIQGYLQEDEVWDYMMVQADYIWELFGIHLWVSSSLTKNSRQVKIGSQVVFQVSVPGGVK